MGFFNFLTGADKFKKAAKTQAKSAAENRALATKFTSQSIADLDKALSTALGELNAGQSTATNALTSALSPYADAGKNALQMIMDGLGLNGAGGSQNALAAFRATPGYQFAMDEGVNALDRSATARGNLFSGGAVKALTRFGQGLADQTSGNWLDRLVGLMGSGQSAAGTIGTGTANILSQFAGNRADALLGVAGNKVNARSNGLAAINDANAQVGAAKAGGLINTANAQNNLLSNALVAIARVAGSR